MKINLYSNHKSDVEPRYTESQHQFHDWNFYGKIITT